MARWSQVHVHRYWSLNHLYLGSTCPYPIPFSSRFVLFHPPRGYHPPLLPFATLRPPPRDNNYPFESFIAAKVTMLLLATSLCARDWVSRNICRRLSLPSSLPLIPLQSAVLCLWLIIPLPLPFLFSSLSIFLHFWPHVFTLFRVLRLPVGTYLRKSINDTFHFFSNRFDSMIVSQELHRSLKKSRNSVNSVVP